MIKIRFAALAAVAIGTFVVSAPAQQATPDGKIVVINTDVFPDKVGELKQKYEQVQGKFKPQSDEIQSLDAEAKKLANEIQQGQSNLNPAALQEKQGRLDEIKRRGTRKLEDFQTDYGKTLDTETKPIRDKLLNFVQNYATQHGIIMIIDLPRAAQAGILAWWSQTAADITDDFVAEYNKANPVAGGAASQPARPSAQPPTQTPAKKP